MNTKKKGHGAVHAPSGSIQAAGLNGLAPLPPPPNPCAVQVSAQCTPGNPTIISGSVTAYGMQNPGAPIVTLFPQGATGVSGPNITASGAPPATTYTYTYTVQAGSSICGAEVVIVAVVQDLDTGNCAGSTQSLVVQCGAGFDGVL